jgi:hypothetical protein
MTPHSFSFDIVNDLRHRRPDVVSPSRTFTRTGAHCSKQIRNAQWLIKAKRHYDPDNLFHSAIPLPSDKHPVELFRSRVYTFSPPQHRA